TDGPVLVLIDSIEVRRLAVSAVRRIRGTGCTTRRTQWLGVHRIVGKRRLGQDARRAGQPARQCTNDGSAHDGDPFQNRLPPRRQDLRVRRNGNGLNRASPTLQPLPAVNPEKSAQSLQSRSSSFAAAI